VTNESRSYPSRPIVGVGAVIVDDGRVLLVKRERAPLKGEWSLPGGAVEVGETLASAIQREVLEETGLVVSVGPVVEVLDRIHTDGAGRVEYHSVLIDYACALVGGWLAPQSDAADAKWATREQLNECGLHAHTRAVIDKVLDLVSRPA
jgi:8-oxo-dGTP diphosphatase